MAATTTTSTTTIKPINKNKTLLIGSLSGFITCILFQPLDLLKTRIQNDVYYKDKRIFHSLRRVLKMEGVLGLWSGTSATLLRNVPGMGLYFYTFEYLKKHMLLPTTLSSYQNLAAGGLARGSIGLLLNPITMVKLRIESEQYSTVKTIRGAVKNIYQLNGVKGFFNGFLVTFIRDAPYAGLYTHFYFNNKVAFGKLFGEKEREGKTPNFKINLLAGITSGLLANGITQPFDYLKTKVQLEPKQYPNFLKGIRYIYQSSNGNKLTFINTFYKGFLLRCLRKSFSSAISWFCYDLFCFYL
ncbi:mitochondrial carrier [Neoconidiobolus thromboides FSU 785]|nr:mitochondrial carrier [Neoconidiobolus thromboides FSU 785]